MNKKLIVKLGIILLTITLLASFTVPVFAAGPGDFTPSPFDNDNGKAIVGKVLGFLQWVGAALAVIMLIAIGIQYMVGSAEQKAEYKKTMVPYIVGAILIFAAPTIANIIYNAIASNS